MFSLLFSLSVSFYLLKYIDIRPNSNIFYKMAYLFSKYIHSNTRIQQKNLKLLISEILKGFDDGEIAALKERVTDSETENTEENIDEPSSNPETGNTGENMNEQSSNPETGNKEENMDEFPENNATENAEENINESSENPEMENTDENMDENMTNVGKSVETSSVNRFIENKESDNDLAVERQKSINYQDDKNISDNSIEDILGEKELTLGTPINGTRLEDLQPRENLTKVPKNNFVSNSNETKNKKTKVIRVGKGTRTIRIQ